MNEESLIVLCYDSCDVSRNCYTVFTFSRFNFKFLRGMFFEVSDTFRLSIFMESDDFRISF